jgi:hypothetical protein
MRRRGRAHAGYQTSGGTASHGCRCANRSSDTAQAPARYAGRNGTALSGDLPRSLAKMKRAGSQPMLRSCRSCQAPINYSFAGSDIIQRRRTYWCQKPKITSSAANARMPVTAPKKISERSSLRMLARQLHCDGKNFTIRNPEPFVTKRILLINPDALRNGKHGKWERQITIGVIARGKRRRPPGLEFTNIIRLC